jgi:DNA-binding CsgD family transcriptional regulator
LIRVIRDDRRTTVRLAHPLYGEVVRQRCPVTRVRRLLADLTRLIEDAGARRRDDLLRVAIWRLDSDTARDPGQLLRACRQAFATYDIPLAMRLGSAAMAAGGGFDAAEVLATLLMFAEQPAEALRILDSVDHLITEENQRSRWLGVRGITTYWGLTDECTLDALATEGAKLQDPRERTWVQAVESIMRLHHGEQAAAVTLATSVLDSPASAPGPRALARSTMAHLQAARGHPVKTMRAMAAVEASAAEWRAETPYIQLAVELARGTAMILAGDLHAVNAIVAAEFAGMADAGDLSLGSGYLTLVRAQAARLRGQLTDAARYASQASAILSSGRVYAGLAHAERAHVAALMGQQSLATEAMAEADRRHQETMTILYPWIEQARAWVAACNDDIPTAIDVLRRLAERLRTDGFAGHEVFALHDLIRLGAIDGPAERLQRLGNAVEGALAQAMAWHARAAAGRDGAALMVAADEFADLGMNLYAAEAAANAVSLLRAVRSSATPRAAGRLSDLIARCDGARTPALDVKHPTLTARERQIAKLAAAGVPSKEIADQLYLSSRTVDNHLMRVYAKLGVGGRAELAAALRTLPALE